MRVLKPCLHPGCPELVMGGRCHKHQAAYERQHKGNWPERRAVYASPRWRGLRRQVLREQPWCNIPGCPNLSYAVDHIVGLRDGGEPFARSNVQGLCAKHHGEKTAGEVWSRK